jgi:hypothetical protein
MFISVDQSGEDVQIPLTLQYDSWEPLNYILLFNYLYQINAWKADLTKQEIFPLL